MQNLPPVDDLTSQIVLKSTFAQRFGGFSDVFRGTLAQLVVNTQTIENVPVAVKALRIIDTCPRERALQRRNREVGIWMRLRHPNIATCYGICYIEHRPALVLAWHENGTASSYLKGRAVSDKLRIVREIAQGLAYMHASNIVHGDLKGSNILISDQGQALISDFGLSRIDANVGPTGNTTSCAGGSDYWQAPELFIEYLPTPTTHLKVRTQASDVWAFVCTVYELLTGTIPYSGLRYRNLVAHAVLGGDIPIKPEDRIFDALPQLKLLLLDCWNVEPGHRPSMAEILLRL